MTKIKFCGIRRPEDAAYCNEILPEYAGFIFFAKSRRYVEPAAAHELRQIMDQRIETVGVFVNESEDFISTVVQNGTISIVQLHGQETPEMILRLQERLHVPVIKAFRIDTEEDIRRTSESPADFILLDSGDGGTGTAFDWKLIRDLTRPYFLAGGLSCDTVAEAVDRFHPYALDVSSGIETDGVKDVEKMRKFAVLVRTANG